MRVDRGGGRRIRIGAVGGEGVDPCVKAGGRKRINVAPNNRRNWGTHRWLPKGQIRAKRQVSIIGSSRGVSLMRLLPVLRRVRVDLERDMQLDRGLRRLDHH